MISHGKLPDTYFLLSPKYHPLLNYDPLKKNGSAISPKPFKLETLSLCQLIGDDELNIY